MENYIVSARKYRPDTFDTVVGQEAITTTLKNAIKSGQLAQAFLFCGPRGVGKTTCARILARTTNCFNPTENMEACGVCESCESFKNNASYNIHELDAASNNSVENIRSLIDQVRVPPQVGKYKIYIIDEVHMLSTAAFNAFLKTLEEPPAYAKFILATTEKHKILPTILSRCQIFDFKRIKIEDIANHLAKIAQKENIVAEPDALHVIAQKADGGLRDALSMFDQLVSFSGNHLTYQSVIENLNVLDYDYSFQITDAFLKGDLSNSLRIFNEIMDRGFDGQHFIIGLGEHLRNLLVCRDPQTVNLLEVGETIKAKYLQQAQNCSVQFLIKALDLNNQCDLNYKNANNKRLSVEIALMQIASFFLPEIGVKPEPPAFIAPANISAEAVAPQTKASEFRSDEETKNTTQPTTENVPLAVVSPSPPLENAAQNSSHQPAKSKPTISLKSALSEPAKPEITETEVAEISKNVTQEEVQNAWTSYSETQNDDPTFSNLLQTSEIRLNEQTLEIVLASHVQEAFLLQKKTDLMNFFRTKLSNTSLQLKTIVNEVKAQEMLYTPSEKFAKLSEKNPELKRLREVLDLEIQY
ncbi:MAG: DNA polymerase III subunit gamma/tau [Bacteroidales bacterium]|jgi:DNA polymerase-3 subunit gamma/tau|nr:DNA polymerase III subunit gamma/tau [Bacteroidales bacterium]